MNTAQVFGAPLPSFYEGGVERDEDDPAANLLDASEADWRADQREGDRIIMRAKRAVRVDAARAVASLTKRHARAPLAKAEEKGEPAEFRGLPLEIDRPKGFVQEGTTAEGTPWRRVYLYDYGFIPRTLGGDGEGIDVFVGPDASAETAYWATQVKDDGSFDEYKVFVGFPSEARATLAYILHIPEKYLAGMAPVSIEAMKGLLGLEPAEVVKAVTKAATEAAMSQKQATDHRVRKAEGISFDDLRSLVQAAVNEKYPPPEPTDGSYAMGQWITDIYEDSAVYCGADGGLYRVGYSYANGAVTLNGEPQKVVRAYVPAAGGAAPSTGDAAPVQQRDTSKETPMATSAATKTQKDETPGAAAPEGGIGDGTGADDVGSGGADIVLLAQDRLSDIVDAINAGGGMLTSDLQGALTGVVALLETVAPDDDDTAGDDGMAAGEGQPAPMSANEKKEYEEKRALLKRAVANSKRFIAGLAKNIRKARSEGDLKKRAALQALLTKALTYGAEAFGSETGFAGLGTADSIPEFTDPSQLKPKEEATPAIPTPRGQAFEDPNYQAATPGTEDGVGTAQATEKKLTDVTKRLAALKGGAEPVAKSQDGARVGLWDAAYISKLPDSHFLAVEEGARKNAAGQSLAIGPATGFRHFAVKDLDGKLSIPQLQHALKSLPLAGLESEVRDVLTAKAQELLAQAEENAGSAVQKGDRGDDGWPEDLNTPEFRGAEPQRKKMPFGRDDLPGKAAKTSNKPQARAAR